MPQVSSIEGSAVTSGLRIAFAGQMYISDEPLSRQSVPFDNGDASALDSLELEWKPTGPLERFFNEVHPMPK